MIVKELIDTSETEAKLLSVIIYIIKILKPELDLTKDCIFGLKFIIENNPDNTKAIDVEFHLDD